MLIMNLQKAKYSHVKQKHTISTLQTSALLLTELRVRRMRDYLDSHQIKQLNKCIRKQASPIWDSALSGGESSTRTERYLTLLRSCINSQAHSLKIYGTNSSRLFILNEVFKSIHKRIVAGQLGELTGTAEGFKYSSPFGRGGEAAVFPLPHPKRLFY